jgi:hypothetical protein
MGVDAAETEGIDAGAFLPIALRPGAGLADHIFQAELAGGRVNQLLHARRRRDEIVLHGEDHFEQAAHAGSRKHMAVDPFVGAKQRASRRLREEGFHGRQLDLIAHRRARGMALQIIDIRLGLAIGACQRQLLSVAVGHQHMAAACIVGETDRLDNAVNFIVVANGVSVAFHGDHACALSCLQAFRRAVKGDRLPFLRKRLQHIETVIDIDVVGMAHRPRQHHVGFAAGKVIAGHFDGIERRRAGRIQRVARPLQPQRLGGDGSIMAARDKIQVGQRLFRPDAVEGKIVPAKQLTQIGSQHLVIKATHQPLAAVRRHADVANQQAGFCQRLRLPAIAAII